MDRSVFTDGIMVDKTDLNAIESTKSFHILNRFLSGAATGVYSGLEVTVNGINNRKIDIAFGNGYAPNGEYVELTVSQVSVSLSSTTGAGIVNLVCLVYGEYSSRVKPHETDGTTKYARTNRTVRVRVYTQAEYAALDATNSDLSIDAKDRILIVAKITDTGIGLVSGDITSPTAFQFLNYSSAPVNITGTSIVYVSSDTVQGNGTLTFVKATPSLQWQAPGSGVAGTAVILTADGTYVLDGGDGSTITVSVVIVSLPASNKSDSLSIANLYGQSVARFTEIDGLHRSMIGTGTPSPLNPHGLSMSDIGGDITNELIVHQNLEHANGIARISSTSCLFISVDAGTAPDRLLITALSGSDSYYVKGKRLTSIASSVLSFSDLLSNRNELYEIYVDQNGIVKRSLRANLAGAPTISGTQIVQLSEETPAGSKTLDFVFPANTLQWDSGPTVTLIADGIYRLFSEDQISYIDVYVDFSSIPGSSQSDTVTISAAISKTENLMLGFILWTGPATGFLGYGNPGGSGVAFDKRLFGTLTDSEMRDDYKLDRLEGMWREATYPGVSLYRSDTLLLRSFELGTAVGLSQPVHGGIAYVRGKRQLVSGSAGLTLNNNKTNLIYVDSTGQLVVVDTSATSLKSVLNGNTNNYPGRYSVNEELGCPLWLVTTSGGAVTDILDVRRAFDHQTDNRAGFGFSVGYGGEFLLLDGAFEYAKAWFDIVKEQIALNIVGVTGLTHTIDDSGLSYSTVIRGINPRSSRIVMSGTLFSGGFFNVSVEGFRLEKVKLQVSNWATVSNVPIVNSTKSDISLKDLLLYTNGTPGSNNGLLKLTAGADVENIEIKNCKQSGGGDLQYVALIDAVTHGVTGVYVKDNHLFNIYGDYFLKFDGTNVTDSTYNVHITGNRFGEQTDASFVGLILNGGEYREFFVTGNTFRLNDGTTNKKYFQNRSGGNSLNGVWITRNKFQNLTATSTGSWYPFLFDTALGSYGGFHLVNNYIEVFGDGTGLAIVKLTDCEQFHCDQNNILTDGSSGTGVVIHSEGSRYFTINSNIIETPICATGFLQDGSGMGNGVFQSNVFRTLSAGGTAIMLGTDTVHVAYGGNDVHSYTVLDVGASNVGTGANS
jgi:hypothetical protein